MAYPAWRRGYPKIGPTRAHARDLDIFDFEPTDDEMTLIASLDTGASLFFDHRDHAMVSWLNSRVNSLEESA